MVHLMRGAGEQTNASAPRSMPGSRANFADLFGGVRLPLQTFVPKAAGQSPRSRVVFPSLSEITIYPGPATCVAGRRSHFVHIETNRRIGAKRALVILVCGPGGEHRAPGRVAGFGGRRRRRMRR